MYSHFNKHRDLYIIQAWGKARASVPTLKCLINDMASSVHGDDMSSPLSPESLFPDVVLGAGGRQPAGITEKNWIRVSVGGWLTTQTAAAGSPASLHGVFLSCDVGDGSDPCLVFLT